MAERPGRAAEDSGLHTELLVVKSLARPAMEEADMLGRVSLSWDVFIGLTHHVCSLLEELDTAIS